MAAQSQMDKVRVECRLALRVVSACTAVLLGAASLTAYADVASRSETRGWFEASGEVSVMGQRRATELELPPLVSGRPVQGVDMYTLRERLSNEDLGCATVQFQILPGGNTDHFMVLESRPNQGYAAAIIESLSYWRFAPSERPVTSILTVDFADRGPGGVSGGSLIKREHTCFSPRVRVARLNVSGRQVLADPLPYYPPEQVAERKEGCVAIAFEVRPDGLADGYQLVSAEADPQFVKASLQALNQWRFAPNAVGASAQVQILFDAERTPSVPICGTSGSVEKGNHE